jgi:hypothetical protein
LNIQYVFIAFKYYLAETEVATGVQPDYSVMNGSGYPAVAKASYKGPRALLETLIEGVALS